MAQRHHHYERAFERYLRDARLPYVAVNEARKALLPAGADLYVTDEVGERQTIKNFDFLLYGDHQNLIVEVKGRKASAPRARARSIDSEVDRPRMPRLESWVNGDDITALRTWRTLFGAGYTAVIVFLYWCDEPPLVMFGDSACWASGVEVFEHDGRWYLLRAVEVEAYAAAMRMRSPRWGTVHLPTAVYERLARPLAPPNAGGPVASSTARGSDSPDAEGGGAPETGAATLVGAGVTGGH